MYDTNIYKYRKYKYKYKNLKGGNNKSTKPYFFINKSIQNKLLKYQIPHANKLVENLRDNRTVLDASDTGTGKTYVAAAICKQLNLRPIIICPKTVISTWKQVIERFEVKPYLIVNYETIRIGKSYETYEKRKISKYIKIKKEVGFKKMKYTWNVPEDSIFIFDEAHKCKNYGTLNSEILIGAYNTKNKILLLSATIADTPEKFAIFGYVLNFAEKLSQTNDIADEVSITAIKDWISRVKNPIMSIYSMLYPSRASRMSIRELGDLFPETQISSIAYNMGKEETKQIEKEYKNISIELDNLKDKKIQDKKNPFVILLRAHQKIELLKCATIIELAKDYLENNFSICIFVNFIKTINILKDELKTNCIIVGGQTLSEREKNINKFQNNKSKIIICNIKAGGIGISLHDIHGGHPRVSFISPTWDATSLVQTLGRVHRASGKSKSLQRIVFCAGTMEEKIANVLSTKLDNLSSINDGDLSPFNIFNKS